MRYLRDPSAAGVPVVEPEGREQEEAKDIVLKERETQLNYVMGGRWTN
jgi:hypothetical protein